MLCCAQAQLSQSTYAVVQVKSIGLPFDLLLKEEVSEDFLVLGLFCYCHCSLLAGGRTGASDFLFSFSELLPAAAMLLLLLGSRGSNLPSLSRRRRTHNSQPQASQNN